VSSTLVVCLNLTTSVWKPLITEYGDYTNLLSVSPEFILQTLPTAVVAFMTQCFYIRRIYLLSTHPIVRWSIPALLSPLIIWQPVGNIIYMTRSLTFKTVSQLGSIEKGVGVAVNACAAAVDLITTATLCILLFGYMSSGSMPATDRLLRLLMISSINNGAWTALFAIVTIALILGRPNDLLYSSTYFPLCALYCNSMLGTLISRKFVRRAGRRSLTQPHITTYQTT